MGVLFLVTTPIGNLEDITLRALRVLRESALIATEDTRTTGRLLKHFEISTPMLSYFEHNKLARLDKIVDVLAGEDVALVSEAGTPLVSDPGYELVRAVLAAGFDVVPVPGPSAPTAALSASGLATDRFLFLGFLPRKAGERRQALTHLAQERATLILFEAPHRLKATLRDAAALLGPERRCAVCRELTKLHEEIWRGTLEGAVAEWRDREARGEFTLVIQGAGPTPRWDEERVRAALAQHLAAGSRHSDAAREVARLSGWPKSAVYALWPDQV
jgi:16S rRNA (cytidine1402-2'-O)-methyltransferase